LPLLQALAITFSGAPIPFAKNGGFPPKPIKDILESIKADIKKGKEALNALKMSFRNKVNEATGAIKNGLETVELGLKDITANGFAKLQTTLPDLFSRTGSVATARQNLLNRLGSVTTYANDNNNNLLGMNLSQWSMLGNTLYGATQSFKNHTNDISGVNNDTKLLIKEEIYGNVALSGTVNTSSNVATVNLSKTQYPLINVGSTIAVNSVLYVVTGKTFTGHAPGTVNVDNSISNTKIVTENIAVLNLANIIVGAGSTLKIVPGMYINVNNEIKQVNSINVLGDFLTVTRAFRNSVNSGTQIFKETGFTINTNFTTSNTDIIVHKHHPFVCNSVCLDNVITGNGTSFTSALSVGNKIYYDELEYFVESVTNTTITVDAPLRGKEDMVVYKVNDEKFVNRFTEFPDYEEVLDNFALSEQLLGGEFMNNFSTKYRNSAGQYVTVSANNSASATKSLQNGSAYMAAINKTVQGLIDDLQNDAIRFMSDNELTIYLEAKLQEIEDLRATLEDSIKEDLAAINAVKGLLKGLLKLWKVSCSKKKYKSNESNPVDDDFLRGILVPDPTRQGCDATDSDLPEILDDTDIDITVLNLPDAPAIPLPEKDVDTGLFDPELDTLFVLERQRNPGDQGDIVIDNDPEAQLPAPIEDPCLKPC